MINGQLLTDAQAMAVRVACTCFEIQAGSSEGRRGIGPAADGYTARLREVFSLMVPHDTAL
jgi:hypothetical protein